jgi:ferredoxin-NADP reductase
MLYRSELEPLEAADVVTFVYTREVPAHVTRPPGRVTMQDLSTHTLPPTASPAAFVCGPTGFVETVLHRLVALGHDPQRLRAERYGEGSAAA